MLVLTFPFASAWRIIFEKILIIEIIEELESVLSNSIGFILKICKKGWEEMQKVTDEFLKNMSFDESD